MSAHDRVVSGRIWGELTDRIRALHERIVAKAPGDPAVQAEGLRYLTRYLAAGIAVCVAHDDADSPEFGRMIENHMSWGLDNPDCLYTYCRLRGDAAYRIVGTRGSACHIEFQVNTGHYADGQFSDWKAVGAVNGDALVTDADGGFELFLGGERRDANFIALDDDANFILVRQYFNDWDHEVPAVLAIERADAALPAPPLTPERIAAHLDLLMMWLETGAGCWADLGFGIAAAAPGSITPFRPPDEAAGLKGQAYGMGAFHCPRGEAVLLELTPPPCRMWSVSLADIFWQSPEFAMRQTSLNGTQARADTDGVVRVVMAHDDPGVPNWLDVSECERGTLGLRYLMPECDELPTMTYTPMPVAEVRRRIPADTPGVTAAERDDTLKRRARAVARRYRR